MATGSPPSDGGSDGDDGSDGHNGRGHGHGGGDGDAGGDSDSDGDRDSWHDVDDHVDDSDLEPWHDADNGDDEVVGDSDYSALRSYMTSIGLDPDDFDIAAIVRDFPDPIATVLEYAMAEAMREAGLRMGE